MKVILKTVSTRLTYWRTILSTWRQKVHVECIYIDDYSLPLNDVSTCDTLVLIDSYGLEESTLRQELLKHIDCFIAVIDFEAKWASYLIRESESFRIDDYISGNISENRIKDILNRCVAQNFRQYFSKPQQIFITIWNKGEKVFLNAKDIYLLESFGAYTRVYAHEQEFVVSKTLKNLLQTLPDYFIRTHRSFAVHMGYINSMRGDYILLQNGKSVRASKQGKKNLFIRLEGDKYAIAQ